jgi:hypothetical protein
MIRRVKVGHHTLEDSINNAVTARSATFVESFFISELFYVNAMQQYLLVEGERANFVSDERPRSDLASRSASTPSLGFSNRF